MGAATDRGPAPPATGQSTRFWRAGGRTLQLGLVLLVAVDVSLIAKGWLYPPSFVAGTGCSCGTPDWLTVWDWAMYALLALAAALIVVGVYRIRRSARQDRDPRARSPTPREAGRP